MAPDLASRRRSNPIAVVTANPTGTRKMQSHLARHFLRKRLLAAVIGIASVVPLAAAPLHLPPVTSPVSEEHHVGKLIFFELVTPDLGVAKRFYGALFGWTFRDVQSGDVQYAEASLNGRTVAGMVHKDLAPGQQRQPAWLSFISVRDVDGIKKTALAHGAKVLFEPHSIPDRGREAVLSDPQGAVFAVLASSSGDPPDVLAAPGEWIWSSLQTTNADTDAAFYQALFDYDVFDVSSDAGAQHLMLASDEYARASANTLPANRPNAHPHWLNFVRVDDAAKSADTVVALGGRVLVAPRVDRHGGKVAVVADPSGAPFGLLEWTDADSKEVSK
jgi:uncharacterized protein